MSDARTSSSDYYAYVDCTGLDPEIGLVSCGTVGLTEAQYEQQLMRPNARWRCPRCGAESEYNDTLSEQAQGVE